MANRKQFKLPAENNRARSLLLLAVFGGPVKTITQADKLGRGDMTIYSFGSNNGFMP